MNCYVEYITTNTQVCIITPLTILIMRTCVWVVIARLAMGWVYAAAAYAIQCTAECTPPSSAAAAPQLVIRVPPRTGADTMRTHPHNYIMGMLI